MYGSARIRLLDRGLALVDGFARLARAVIHAAAALPRWRTSDLYAAGHAARFTASHALIDQAADAIGDDEHADVDVVVARTWPWFGAAFVIEEDDQ